MTSHAEVLWSRLVPDSDRLGVGCDEDGPRIGPVRLLRRTELDLEPRWVGELDFVIGKALGQPVQFANKMRGLRVISEALNRGDVAYAMLVTQFMWLPPLPDEEAFSRAVGADSLAKAGFNPDQPRDEKGRWADEAGGGDLTVLTPVSLQDTGFTPVQEFVFPQGLVPWLEQIKPVRPLPMTPPFPGDIVVPPAVAVPRTLDNPFPKDEGCRQEWEDAKAYCGRLAAEGRLGKEPYREHGKYYEQCVRGQVSERCGGNPWT